MPAPVRRTLPLACLSLLALAMVSGTALAGNGGIAPPAETPQAGRIQDLHWLLLGITGVIFVLVEGALIAFVIRFRNAGRPRDLEGPQIRGHTRLELIWTGIPVLILAAIIGVVFYKLPGIKDVAAAAGPKTTVRVEGRQYYWRYTYPNGAVSVNELRLPAGRPVDLEITAPANDVIHSWWVPPLAGKMDAIPGKVNHLRFETATTPGVYKGQCAEFCGVQHALMLASVVTMPEAEYDDWVAVQLAKSGEHNFGRQTFEGACGPCHGMKGEGLIGPPLTGNATLAQRERLMQLLENGKNAMPPVGRGWDERQIDALVRYVQEEFASGG